MSGAASLHARDIEGLAEFAAGLRLEQVPPDVAERARSVVLDCVGCIVAGQGPAEMAALRRTEATRNGGPATVLGTPLGLSCEAAAFVNGTAGTWLDLDEGNLHTKGHPGIQILPAAFAEAEAADRSGAELLLSLIAGYEVGCRVYGATAARLAIHPHGTFGPLAAAVALGKQRGHAADRLARTIAVAATLGIAASRGTLRDGATVRNAYTGLSGRMGFLAHDLVGAGFTGERDALASFGAIYGERYTPGYILDGLGQEWLILRNYFKLHASARYVHSAIDLLDAIDPIDPAAIASIEIDTYAMAATMANRSVDTPFGTRFSIPFAVAAHLLGHDRDLAADGSAAFSSPAVHALAQRVELREIAEFTRAYPARQPSRMRIRLADGTLLEAAAERIKGEAEHPHSRRELEDKFRALARPAWGDRGDEALAALRAIDTQPSIGRLGRALRGMASPEDHG